MFGLSWKSSPTSEKAIVEYDTKPRGASDVQSLLQKQLVDDAYTKLSMLMWLAKRYNIVISSTPFHFKKLDMKGSKIESGRSIASPQYWYFQYNNMYFRNDWNYRIEVDVKEVDQVVVYTPLKLLKKRYEIVMRRPDLFDSDALPTWVNTSKEYDVVSESVNEWKETYSRRSLNILLSGVANVPISSRLIYDWWKYDDMHVKIVMNPFQHIYRYLSNSDLERCAMERQNWSFFNQTSH